MTVIGSLGAAALVLFGVLYFLIFGFPSFSSDSSLSWKSELPSTATEIQESVWADGFLPDYSYILRARISGQEFADFCLRLKLTPHSESRTYSDDKHWLSWTALPNVDGGDWWGATESLERTFVRQDGTSWSFAKYENGYLYFQSLCH